MKKYLILLLSISLILCNPNSASAASSTRNIVVETFEDGSYIETVIEEIETASSYATTYTKSGKKTSTYKNSSGDTLWSVSVTGTFTYDGSSATCTKSTVSTTSYNSNWKISSSSASKSGATATATATAKKYLDGTYIKSITETVTLTCSKSGTLS